MITSPPLRASFALMVSCLLIGACSDSGGARSRTDGPATSADGGQSPDSGDVAPLTCSPGEFSSGAGQARSCLSCPAGTFSTVANATECKPWTDCPPGQVVAHNGSATADRTCSACPHGEYSAITNATACSAWMVCAPGTFVGTSPTAQSDGACVPCQSGHFSTTQNAEACTRWQDCAPGQHVSSMPTTSNDRVCQVCPSATYTSQANQALCLPQNACAAGTEQTAPATATRDAVCVACPAGTHCAGGAAPKQACAGDNWDDDGSAATPCVAKTTCGPGFYVTGTGTATTDRTCSPCAAGTFSAGNNAGTCSPWSTCPVGSSITSGASATADRACSTCPAGQFSATMNATACTAWSDCAPGTFVSALPTKEVDRSCTACAAGTFSATANASSCTTMATCNPGQYMSTVGAPGRDRVCSACPAGTVTLVSNVVACQPVAQTLAAGRDHTCAVRAGAVRCWGAGYLGYPGQSVIGDDELPSSVGDIQVGGVVEAVAAGSFHTCALLSGGKVRCWGDNGRGPLGYGSGVRIGDDETPASAGDVDVGATVTQLVGGLYHTCATIAGGHVRCWGDNGSGQLGYGHTNRIGDNEVPASAGNVNVGGTVVQFAAGHEHTCAVLSGGQVR